MKRVTLFAAIVLIVVLVALLAPSAALAGPEPVGTKHSVTWEGTGAGQNHAGTLYWLLAANAPVRSATLTVYYTNGTWRTVKACVVSGRVAGFTVTGASPVRWAEATFYSPSKYKHVTARLRLVAWTPPCLRSAPGGPSTEPPLYGRVKG